MCSEMQVHRDHRSWPPHWSMNWLPKLSRRLKKTLKKQVLRRQRSTDYVRNSGRRWHTRDLRIESVGRKEWKGQAFWFASSTRFLAA